MRSLIKKMNSLRSWNWKPGKIFRPPAQLSLPILIGVILLSACGEQVALSTPDYFIPPTLETTPRAIQLVTPTPVPATPTPTCENNLTFKSDVTIPDGTTFAPGASMEKVWLVTNSGSCDWNSFYRMRLVSGSAMGAETEQALFPARSGSDAEIRILFTAPIQPGVYNSSWQAYEPDGEPFGELFFMTIIVDPDLLEPTSTEEGNP